MSDVSAAYSRFIESMKGSGGFDLAALQACKPEERDTLAELLATSASDDWRCVQALLALGTPDTVAAARRGLTGSDRLLRLYTAEQLHLRGESGFLPGAVAEALDNAGPDDGLNVAFDLAVKYPGRDTNQALLDGTIEAERERVPAFGAALFYALGATHQRDGGPFKPFFWELGTMMPGERAEALRNKLAQLPGDISGLDWGEGLEPPAGPVRRITIWLMRLLALATAGLLGWYLFALGTLPDRAFDAIHAPLEVPLIAGGSAMLFLPWFGGRWRRTPLLLVGLASLVACGLSMRWIDSSSTGVREYWSGLEVRKSVLAGDLCYRIDGKAIRLRGELPEDIFTYPRGVWPTDFDEAAVKHYFYSDLPVAEQADGWKCRKQDPVPAEPALDQLPPK